MSTRKVWVGALATTVLALAAPAVASAATKLYVNGAAPVGTGKSCESPSYTTVQAAITAASSGATIEVCAGTYTEQIEITKPLKLELATGSGTATLQLPSAPTASATSCDTAEGVEAGQVDEVSICTPGKVAITNLRINALAPIESCAGGLNAINVAGGAELTAKTDEIVGASTTVDAYKGCQKGIAVNVGSGNSEVGHAKLEDDSFTGYQKNGPTASNAGSTLTIKGSVIQGEGPSSYIAQNGVQIAYGAKGTIEENTISDNECELSGVCSDSSEEATGLLFYGAAAGSKVSENTIADNDIGVYYASTSATQPTHPEVKFSYDKLQSDRYQGFVLEQGDVSLKGESITGTGQEGIEFIQSASQPYGDHSSAKGLTIEDQSVAALYVATDGSPSDPPGSFKISDSSISKNAAAVIDPSPNFVITQKEDS